MPALPSMEIGSSWTHPSVASATSHTSPVLKPALILWIPSTPSHGPTKVPQLPPRPPPSTLTTPVPSHHSSPHHQREPPPNQLFTTQTVQATSGGQTAPETSSRNPPLEITMPSTPPTNISTTTRLATTLTIATTSLPMSHTKNGGTLMTSEINGVLIVSVTPSTWTPSQSCSTLTPMAQPQDTCLERHNEQHKWVIYNLKGYIVI